MFDLGLSEIFLVSVVALVILGPERLPKAMRFIGRLVGKVRQMATVLKSELNAQIEQSELKEVANVVKESAHILQEEVSGSLNEISETIHSGKDAWQNLPPLRTPADFAEEEFTQIPEQINTPSIVQKSRQMRKTSRHLSRAKTRLRGKKIITKPRS